MVQKRKKLMILVVDDTINNLTVMQMLFENIKDVEIDVKTALNGQQALKVVQNTQQGNSFSHIFLDLHMPIMDGYQVPNHVIDNIVIGCDSSQTDAARETSSFAGYKDHCTQCDHHSSVQKALGQ